MTALIVVLITLSLMGSALWIMPPKQERRRMALRMLARQHNLIVQLTSIGLPDKWDKSKEAHKVCGYAHYRAKPLEQMTDKVLLLTYDVWKYQEVTAGWWSNQILPLSGQDKANLALLLSSVMAIEISRESVVAYWQEAGGEEMVDVMAKLLPSLAEMPLK
ncbi:hypothetical protein GCM10009112_26020 [Marinomonas arenicola]|uniref:hypothetical protein n=1 Tax=Marinomonas TaxID=28253 RepID=UPI001055C16C|nr:hypothetical protein [Marinomonas sp. KMM3893]